jgi:hypothetical protein
MLHSLYLVQQVEPITPGNSREEVTAVASRSSFLAVDKRTLATTEAVHIIDIRYTLYPKTGIQL